MLPKTQMNIKIILHLMPWELDFTEFIFTQLAKSKKYISPEDTVCIHTVLNLSSFLIDWNNSILPKEFFIDKFNNVIKHINEFEIISNIYEGDQLYGHLDLQKITVQKDIDYYVTICPDMYFHSHLLHYLIEFAKKINDKYFLIIPESPQLWDMTWDELVNKNFKHINYKDWDSQNINNIIHFIDTNDETPILEKINNFKYAGWFDLYNKNFYEKFVPVMDDWHGYGPWDFFGMNVASFAKMKYNTNIEQYIIRNQVICERNIGIFQDKSYTNFYKKYLKLNMIPDQRKTFELKFQEYLIRWHKYAIENNIL